VYTAGSNKFLVSPVNARNELTRFIKGADKELLIYDPNISDRAMLRLLIERKDAGVKVRILGCAPGKHFQCCELKRMRLNARTIVRDQKDVFVVSQRMRQVEFDDKRV